MFWLWYWSYSQELVAVAYLLLRRTVTLPPFRFVNISALRLNRPSQYTTLKDTTDDQQIAVLGKAAVCFFVFFETG